MKKLFIALLLLATITAKAQTTYVYQAVTRNIITATQYCNNVNKCNITNTGAAYHQLTWTVNGTLSVCSVRVDSSADGITWGTGDIIAAQTCTSNGQTISTSHVVNFIRVNVTTITPVSTASLTVNLTGYVNLPSGGSTVIPAAATFRSVAAVAAIGTATLFTNGGADAAYLYIAEVDCTTASAAATVTLTLTYTDTSNTVQTITPAAAICTTLGASSYLAVNSPIAVKASTIIQYATSIANTPTYDIRLQLVQLSSN